MYEALTVIISACLRNEYTFYLPLLNDTQLDPSDTQEKSMFGEQTEALRKILGASNCNLSRRRPWSRRCARQFWFQYLFNNPY